MRTVLSRGPWELMSIQRESISLFPREFRKSTPSPLHRLPVIWMLRHHLRRPHHAKRSPFQRNVPTQVLRIHLPANSAIKIFPTYPALACRHVSPDEFTSTLNAEPLDLLRLNQAPGRRRRYRCTRRNDFRPYPFLRKVFWV
jgi:hypothetical protein